MKIFKSFFSKQRNSQSHSNSFVCSRCEKEFDIKFKNNFHCFECCDDCISFVGLCGDSSMWKNTEEGLVIFGSGAITKFWNINDFHRMTVYDPHNLAPQYSECGFGEIPLLKNTSRIIIKRGISEIGKGVCSDIFLGLKLKEIYIPETVVSIHPDALSYAKSFGNLVVYGIRDSYVQKFSNENDFEFREVENRFFE